MGIERMEIMWFFDYGHLPEPLRKVSAEFHRLACYIEEHLQPGAERSTALRKLLEAKDTAVRSRLLSVDAADK